MPGTGQCEDKRVKLALYAGGAILLAATVAMAVLSREFVYGVGHRQRPILTFVGVYLGAWLGFALAWRGRGVATGRGGLAVVVGTGLVLRLIMLFSSPVQESDFYRYIWDGQTLRHGISPYALAPVELAVTRVAPEPEQQAAAQLVHERINYPEVKTIYPPLAQAVFWLNAWVFSWRPHGPRFTFLLVDMLLLALLLGVVRAGGLPRLSIIAYAWNPLVLKEITNAMHLDIACALFLGVYVYAVLRGRFPLALLAIWLATFVKLTPLALLPLLLVCWRRCEPRARVAWYALAFAAATLAGIALMGYGADNPFAGLREFSSAWAVNGSLFPLLKGALAAIGVGAGAAAGAAKTALLALFGGYLLWACRTVRAREQLLSRSLLALALLFLVSPVGNPWYLVWLLPFVVLGPGAPVLLLMAFTSLYYIEFHLLYRQAPESYFVVLRAVEYIPLYACVAFILWRRPQRLLALKTDGEASA